MDTGTAPDYSVRSNKTEFRWGNALILAVGLVIWLIPVLYCFTGKC